MIGNDNLSLLFVLGLTSASLLFYINKTNINRKSNDNKETNKEPNKEPDKFEIKTYMLRDLENKMITWKQKNPNNSYNYHKFLRDNFPENIKFNQDGDVTWVDPGVESMVWTDLFKGCNGESRLHQLGPPPYI